MDKHNSNLLEAVDKDLPLSLPDQETIRSEVNLLILPFFALSRKELKGKTETIYEDVIQRREEQLKISWNVLAHPKLGYPGPFDKEVYKAIEEILTELIAKGLPLRNPIVIGSFYELCQRMDIENYGGWQYRKIKEALERIVATTVKSQGAFYNKAKKEWIEDVFHLYERVVFKGKELPDGRIADTNYLFLSSWYLENLNALYVKPIDYKYWRGLKSTIAQRLYELLGVKFYRVIHNNLPYLRYKYSTLCQLLPVARQRYLSKAKEKLGSAHQELIATSFLSKVLWRGIRSQAQGKGKDWFIYYYPGLRAIQEVERYGIELEEGYGEQLPSLMSSPAKASYEVRALVEDILEVTGDEQSRPFYTKVAKLCPSDLIHRVLSEVKDEWHRGLIRTTKGAVFTDKLKRYCQERGIDLGLKTP